MKYILFALSLFPAFHAIAQKHCYTTEMTEQLVRNNPEYLKNHTLLEDFTKQYKAQSVLQRTGTRQIYVIPVVFHILHNYGFENISDEQVIDAVNILTRDFRKRNADTIDIVPAFQSIAADCDIEFRLATIDPNGNCTNGIEHIYTTKTYLADDDSKLNPWPSDKYLNIWTASTLLNSGAAAYAYYPGAPGWIDGIMCLSNYVGSIGSSSLMRSRVLTHEVGHYLNLRHVWGNNNSPGVACGDDLVNDTPESIGWDHCDLAGSYCNPPALENVQNYMEYSYCDNMFTQGQKNRMQAALTSSIGDRNNLWSPSNLVATGTDGSPVTICAPVADFKIDYTNACSGTAITFFDQSWNAPVTSWNWSFPGGTPSTSTAANPSVVYSAAGIYNASLTITSAGGTDSITKNSVIRITGPAVSTMPYAEDFENPSSLTGVDGWTENPDLSSTGAWTRSVNANSTSGGTASLKMNNFFNSDGAIDSWISPSIDFTNITYPIYFSFKLSNAQRNSISNDELRLFYSTNCGKTWSNTGFNKSGASLSTVGILNSNFTPTVPSQWRQENVNVNPVQNKPNVRFKFQNTSNNGNNVYIDDINITGVYVGIDESEEISSGFDIYPNPSFGETNIRFGLVNSARVVIEIKNMIGQTIEVLSDEQLGSGIHEKKINTLSSGIYLIDMNVNNHHHLRKLIISQ